VIIPYREVTTFFLENGPPPAEIDYTISARLNQCQDRGGDWHTDARQRVQ
jgi:hypothetical protein